MGREGLEAGGGGGGRNAGTSGQITCLISR